jgi:hypothetical protein
MDDRTITDRPTDRPTTDRPDRPTGFTASTGRTASSDRPDHRPTGIPECIDRPTDRRECIGTSITEYLPDTDRPDRNTE